MADLILACARPGRPGIAAERLRRAALRLAPPEVPLREPLLVETAGVVAAVANPTAEGVFVRGGKDELGTSATGGGALRRRPLRPPRRLVAGRARCPRGDLRPRQVGRRPRRAGQRHLRLAHALVRAHRRRLPGLHLAARPGDAAGQLRARARGHGLLPLLGHARTGGLVGRAPATPAAGRARRARSRLVATHSRRDAVRSGRGRRRQRGPGRPPARGHRRHLRQPQPRPRALGAAALRRSRQPHAARLPRRERPAAALRHLDDARLAAQPALGRLHRPRAGTPLPRRARAAATWTRPTSTRRR